MQDAQGRPECLKKGQWLKNPSPEEPGKGHRIVNTQLPHQGAGGRAHGTHR